MKSKFLNRVGILLLVILGVMMWNKIPVEASMASEARDYTLGEIYRGSTWNSVYYKFTIEQKSHVSLLVTTNDDYAEFILYNSTGRILLSSSNLTWKKNNATGVRKGNGYRTLAKGVYYLEIKYANHDYSFKIQPEKLITLAKGAFSSLKSKKAGQMTVVSKKIPKAIGYRIQYSTDYRFRKGVKTVYTTSRTKTIKGLKKGKKYYVKVCPFNVYDDGEYVFGANSYVKAVTVKKK